MVQTFTVGFLQSEGLMQTLDDYFGRFTTWFESARPDISDQQGSGNLTLHSLGSVPPNQGQTETYVAISTGIVDPAGEGPVR